MTAVTLHPQPSISRRALAAALPFVAGGLLGASATFGLTSDSSSPAPRTPSVDRPASATAVVVSPTAAERWALVEDREQVNACTITHRAPDAVTRCLGG